VLCAGVCDDQDVRPSVLIVDDHADFRDAASALLEREGFTVLGTVVEGDAAIAASKQLRPEVVLLDVQLPGLDGFAVAELLAAGWSMLGCGLVAWSRWPQSRAGVLMTAVGLSWFAGN
jgi:CheY-like chemotaxis protein